jgi:hypothetical protein
MYVLSIPPLPSSSQAPSKTRCYCNYMLQYYTILDISSRILASVSTTLPCHLSLPPDPTQHAKDQWRECSKGDEADGEGGIWEKQGRYWYCMSPLILVEVDRGWDIRGWSTTGVCIVLGYSMDVWNGLDMLLMLNIIVDTNTLPDIDGKDAMGGLGEVHWWVVTNQASRSYSMSVVQRNTVQYNIKDPGWSTSMRRIFGRIGVVDAGWSFYVIPDASPCTMAIRRCTYIVPHPRSTVFP